MKYCTYLTIYSGNRMPPFYIGFSLTKKVKINNYHGSVKSKQYKDIWLNELENHPDKFKTVILTYHDTKTEATTKESFIQRFFHVHKNPMYINKHISNLHFCPEKASIETIQKRSAAISGHKHHFFGKKFTDNHKKQISQSLSGRRLSDTHKQNISKNHAKPMLGKTHSTETREHWSKIRKGRSFTSEQIEKMSKTWEVVYPNGEKTIIKNLRAFCEEHNIHYANLSSRGISRKYKATKV